MTTDIQGVITPPTCTGHPINHLNRCCRYFGLTGEHVGQIGAADLNKASFGRSCLNPINRRSRTGHTNAYKIITYIVEFQILIVTV